MSGRVVEAKAPLTSQRILLVHSNTGPAMERWHALRASAAKSLGFNVSTFGMAAHFPHTVFPRLDRLWRKRDAKLMRFYERLGTEISSCDVLIHFNGALIHPEFLAQFRKFTVYHCADDPDASDRLSRPVAAAYDLCAIANPACVDAYRSWGCRNVVFWPLGAFVAPLAQADEYVAAPRGSARDIPLIFIGSKLGVPSVRFIGKYLGLYAKKRFMNRVEKQFPNLVAYGSGWRRGWVDDALTPDLYRRSRVGLNVHNSLGPINFRLYDLAAFEVCQVCDNKSTLGYVFEEGVEIVGFAKEDECIERIQHFLAHPEEAMRIAAAGRARFQRDYTMKAIWARLFADIERVRGR